MALCLDGTLTKPTIEAKLTAVTGLSASLSYDGLGGRLERNSLVGSLGRKSGGEASLRQRRPFDNYKLSSRIAAKAALSNMEFAKGVLSGTAHPAVLTARLGTTAALHANSFLDASMKSKGVDGYFTIFCPIDYLVACFSMGGWNNDAAWDNDEGWCND